MRRFANLLPSFLLEEPPAQRLAPPRAALTTRIELSSITPVLGGGVEAFEPDAVDVVRPQGIRGQLRGWWRTLYAGEGVSADDLFRREARLWGGVGVPGEGSEEGGSALPSRVRLSVEILDPGRVLPAGHHEISFRGGPKTLPRWSIGSKLAYGLFPLQRSRKERLEYGGGEPMPTKPVRVDLRFRLELTVQSSWEGRGEEAPIPEEALAALWAWVHFGGLGARTRRGFGALAVADPDDGPVLDGLEPERAALWRSLFRPPASSDLSGWLERFGQTAGPHPRGRWGSGRLVAGGQALPRSATAHEEVVHLLATFRQGPGTGRDPGSGRPGASRWPEAHLLRTLVERQEPGHRFDHPPPADLPDGSGAPRAAFGLPIQVQFKDRGDSRANATLLPSTPRAGNRWASPVLLGALAVDGGYLPAILLLGGERPERVEIRFDDRGLRDEDGISVTSATGARSPIAGLLERAGGDAVAAFETWLRRDSGFRVIPLKNPRGGNDG